MLRDGCRMVVSHFGLGGTLVASLLQGPTTQRHQQCIAQGLLHHAWQTKGAHSRQQKNVHLKPSGFGEACLWLLSCGQRQIRCYKCARAEMRPFWQCYCPVYTPSV